MVLLRQHLSVEFRADTRDAERSRQRSRLLASQDHSRDGGNLLVKLDEEEIVFSYLLAQVALYFLPSFIFFIVVANRWKWNCLSRLITPAWLQPRSRL